MLIVYHGRKCWFRVGGCLHVFMQRAENDPWYPQLDSPDWIEVVW